MLFLCLFLHQEAHPWLRVASRPSGHGLTAPATIFPRSHADRPPSHVETRPEDKQSYP